MVEVCANLDTVPRSFKEQPLAFSESGEEEVSRVLRLKQEDPIALQDAVNTSKALVEAVKSKDLEELASVMDNAEEGEFLQSFVLQAVVLALKSASLDVVKALCGYGAPFGNGQLREALHLVCEVTTRDNFSDAWRIIELLITTSGQNRLHIDAPRSVDGFTPLCIACVDACLPLVFKLLELKADPNVITRKNETPIGLVLQSRPEDTDEQKEARPIIANMLKHYGGRESWKDALAASRRSTRVRAPLDSEASSSAVLT